MGLELFSHLPGVPLFELAGHPRFPLLCARAGAALRRFHALPVSVAASFGHEAVLERLTAAADEFPRLLPDERARIDALSAALDAELRATDPGPPRLIHGDFHGDNLLVDGERLALIDFEDCAMGEPAEDFALNWAQLTWRAARPGAGPFPAAGRRAFAEAYLEGADRGTARRLAVYQAMHCFLGAYQSVRRPRDAAPAEDAEILLRAGEEVLSCR
jgi:aminoglycoside phosphotransferase (APT) family kinase protein